MKFPWILRITLLVLFTALSMRAIPLGGEPWELENLIARADAIVILRIEQHSGRFGQPDFYSKYKCYIYQTIKGDIPEKTRTNLELLNTEGSSVTPYAHGSIHLMFLTKRVTEDVPAEYRTLSNTGAQVLLFPLEHEKEPQGKTVEQKVRNVIKKAIAYHAKEHEKEQKFLKALLEN